MIIVSLHNMTCFYNAIIIIGTNSLLDIMTDRTTMTHPSREENWFCQWFIGCYRPSNTFYLSLKRNKTF